MSEIILSGGKIILAGGKIILAGGKIILTSGEIILTSGEIILTSGGIILTIGKQILAGQVGKLFWLVKKIWSSADDTVYQIVTNEHYKLATFLYKAFVRTMRALCVPSFT